MNPDREIWDEFRWEEFMKEQDKKTDRYMELFFCHQDNPDRYEAIARAMGPTWLFEVRDHEKNEFDVIGAEDDGEGEEWKASAGGVDHEFSEFNDVQHLPIYCQCKGFALKALYVVEQLPESIRENSLVVEFLSNAMIVPSKIAAGSGIGFDHDELGGNIACCKRGLSSSNLAIVSLRELHRINIVGSETYVELIDEVTEVRNSIALHILDLRERFLRGG